MSDLREAIRRLDHIKGMCERLGIEYSRDIIAPWRPDERAKKVRLNPMNNGKERFWDYRTGEGGDEVTFWAMANGIDEKEACRQLIDLAGLRDGKAGSPSSRPRKRASVVSRPKPPAKVIREKPKLPAMRWPEPAEIDRISEVRCLPSHGVELAATKGALFVGEWKGQSCWFYGDSECWNVRARRTNGDPFQMGSDRVKAIALPGSWASWPIGIPDVEAAERVLIVEGEGDGLAAWSSSWLEDTAEGLAVVVMGGASVWIPQEALESFGGKRVRIVPHVGDTDRVGERGAVRWGRQLERVGAKVKIFNLESGDLGDLIAKGREVALNVGITQF